MTAPDVFDVYAAERAEIDAGADLRGGATVPASIRETVAGGRAVLADLTVVARRALQLSRRRWRP